MDSRKHVDVYTESTVEKKFKLILLGGNDSTLRNTTFHDTAYAFNIRPGVMTIKTSYKNVPEKQSVVYIYLVNGAGDTLRVTKYVNNYFYISIATVLAGISTTVWDQYRHQLITFLESLASDHCNGKVHISIVSKIDLKDPGHITVSSKDAYRSRDLIRLSFSTVEDFQILRKELEDRLKKNRNTTSSLISTIRQESGDSFLKDNLTIEDFRCPQTFHHFLHQVQSYLDEDPFLLAEGLFEYDVPLVPRSCIDTGIRCGKWYNIHYTPNEEIQIIPSAETQQSIKPPLRYLVWDIEVTKDKLKFPSPHKDCISLISFMYEHQGFLIVNRSILSEDINEFEYYPTKDIGGKFHILNVKDEKTLIEAFYSYIEKISPHIFVTYNGDNFDFEFLRIRSMKYKKSMLAEIGFPYFTADGSVPSKIGQPRTTKTTLGLRQEYQGRYQLHIDCLRWVERDSYLPCGSRGLKAVTKSKLGYNPRELDPELMGRYALEQPRLLAEYSVSDAVATYYLYEKFIHGFTFALASIIPLPPDDVLRKGSGTLCEYLLMAEAYNANLLFPNKYTEPLEKWIDDKLIISETYTGGNVEQLNSGIFRSDISEHFNLNPHAYDSLLSDVDNSLDFWLTYEDGKDIKKENIVNLDEVASKIREALNLYKNSSHVKEEPTIYHYDVAAMYPNIILSNRLQPTAIVLENIHCRHCPHFPQRSLCQKHLNWQWKADVFPLSRSQIEFVRDQLVNERFLMEPSENAPKRFIDDNKSDESSLDFDEEDTDHITVQKSTAYEHPTKKIVSNQPTGLYKSWKDLTEKQRHFQLTERLKLVSKKITKKFKIAVDEKRTATVCMRENSFYVETVRKFRDRRYTLKEKRRLAEEKLKEVKDPMERQRFLSELVLYDSLQLAHKCILNSFYGYVMRKGSRWYSMEMAAIVTFTGVQIIRMAFNLLNDIGKPLELDTDGIWTLLPKGFPQTYNLIVKEPESNKIINKKFNFMCSVLNFYLYKLFKNDQYMTINNSTGVFERSTEHSIFFEVDGPYKAMTLPASEKEGMSVKKRYAVFDHNNTIVELKGFELKRRGELELIKIFQQEVFPKFLEGKTKKEAYAAVATVANRWLDFLDTRGKAADDISEVFTLIAESKFLSKPVSMQRDSKSMGITTAKRLTELLGDPTYINEKGIKCEYVVCANPEMEKTLRVIPLQLFEASLDVQRLHLQRWLNISPSMVEDPRSFLDWSYYRQRLETAILKIIVIPAIREGLTNPVPRVVAPEWISRNLSLTRYNQTHLSTFFQPLPSVLQEDIEMIVPPEKQSNKGLAASPLVTLQPESKDSLSSWLVKRQKLWRSIRHDFLQMRTNYMQLNNPVTTVLKDLTTTSHTTIPYEVFRKHLEENEEEFVEWLILDIEPAIHYNGLFYFYVILANDPCRVFRVPVFHFRQVIVNTSLTSFNINADGIFVEKLRSPHLYTLPRGFQQHHLYQLSMTEEKFKLYHSSLRPTGKILSIYGKQRPLEFDLLFSYGDTIRLNSQDNGEKIKLVTCGTTEAFSGPNAFEKLAREKPPSKVQKSPRVQWVFVIVLHDGPVDDPLGVITFVFRPPILCPNTGEVKVNGNTAIFIGDSTQTTKKKTPSIDFHKTIVTCMKLFNTKKLPNCFTFSDQLTRQIIEHWVCESPECFPTVSLGLKQLHPYIEKLVTTCMTNKEPPIVVSIFTSLPVSILGDFADPLKRPTLQSPIVPLHVTKVSMSDHHNNTRHFFTRTAKLAVQHFLEKLYLVEWSTYISAAVHIPVIKIMQWTTSPHQLQRNILDLMLARGLQANHMIPWDSDQLYPDLGTPLLQDRTIADFELPDKTSTLGYLSYPSISWTITFRLNFNGQLTTEALMNLNKLATVYNDPIRHAFQKGVHSQVKNPSSLFVHRHKENQEDKKMAHLDCFNEMFQHTSNIPAKVLVVLHRCLHHMKTRIGNLTLPEAQTRIGSRHDAIKFLSATTQYVHAWLDTPTSLFYDSALQTVVHHWTMRFMQSLVHEIKNSSENLVKPLLLTPSCLIISTPMLSLSKAQQCLALLFKTIQKGPFFKHVQPQSCLAYRGFYLFNHHMWIGLRLANQHHNIQTSWENQLQSLIQPFPGPLQYFLQRVIEDFITFPLRSAGLSPDQELSSDEEEAAKLDIMNHFAREQILPTHSDQIVNKGVLGLATTWIEKIQDFSILKQEWWNSNQKTVWSNAIYQKIHHTEKMLRKMLHLPYLNLETREIIQKRLDQVCGQLEVPRNILLADLIWSIPNLPGLIKLEQLEGHYTIRSNELCGVTSYGNLVRVVPSLNEDQLQLTLIRVLLTLLASHPFYWSLDTESRETWTEMFASVLHTSAYNKALEYECLYSPLTPVNSVLCSMCGQTFPINITASLIEDPLTQEPQWFCPYCSSPLLTSVIETHLVESFYYMMEAVQAQDIICRKCRQLKKNISATFCECGGNYSCRISRIEFQFLWTTFRSVVEKYPLSFPLLFSVVNQTIEYKCF